MEHRIRPIAHIRTEFASKFGIPRQSGLIEELAGTIVFEPAYRNADALRGIEGYTHLWLIWHFSQGFASREDTSSGREGEAVCSGRGCEDAGSGRSGEDAYSCKTCKGAVEKPNVEIPPWSPTVRPPKLDGNTRVGVFASRSPNRPNGLGLSLVRLTGVDFESPEGPLLHVAGPDLMDATPIFDIKPYMPMTESIPDAGRGVEGACPHTTLAVELPEELAQKLPQGRAAALRKVLAMDPRPGYHDDPERVYGFPFAGFEIRFVVKDGVARVTQIEETP